MNKVELKGMFKGLGIGIIICATIFYGLVLNLRMTYESSVPSHEAVIEEARTLGMIFRNELDDPVRLTENEIIEAAKALGMKFEEE